MVITSEMRSIIDAVINQLKPGLREPSLIDNRAVTNIVKRYSARCTPSSPSPPLPRLVNSWGTHSH